MKPKPLDDGTHELAMLDPDRANAAIDILIDYARAVGSEDRKRKEARNQRKSRRKNR